MRVKNEGRWRWLLLKNRAPEPFELFGVKHVYHPNYKVIKTGASRYDGGYAMWEILGEYDDPKEARAMLALAQASNS